MLKAILKIRLSVLAPVYFVVFAILVFVIPRQTLAAGQLALFSVNSFLFGYYVSPLLNTQKTRVAGLNALARQEEMTILDILAHAHLLKDSTRHILKVKLKTYLESIIGNYHISADNEYYDELLYRIKKTKTDDQDVLNQIYEEVSKTQDHRSDISNLMASKVYSHEWLVAGVLFSITLYFSTMTNFGDSLFFGLMLAVLCAALCMLMTILVKFATLSHKEAKRMWDTLNELTEEHFDDVSKEEVRDEIHRLKLANTKAAE
jgi:hypothetical protein